MALSTCPICSTVTTIQCYRVLTSCIQLRDRFTGSVVTFNSNGAATGSTIGPVNWLPDSLAAAAARGELVAL